MPADSSDNELVEITLELQNNNAFIVTDIKPSNSISARIIKRFNSLSLEPVDRTRSEARHALKGLRFISRQSEPWQKVEERFDSLANDGLLSRNDFGECIGMVDSKEFAVGIFDALARRKQLYLQRITKEELHEFWLKISDQSFDTRLQIFFDMVDTNIDGRITKEEVEELIRLSVSANHLPQLKEKSDEFASMIMEELDPDNLGYIEVGQLACVLLQKDTFYSRPVSVISSAACSQNLSTMSDAIPACGGDTDDIKIISKFRQQMRSVFRAVSKFQVVFAENKRRAWIIGLWLAVIAVLFGWKFAQYKKRAAFQIMGYCLTTAKGAAETLKLNMSLVLLPVCRNTLTWLRSTRLRYVIPFDDNISFHKMIAAAIVIGIILHVGNHLACDFPRILAASPEKYDLIAPYFGYKKPSYLDFVKGVEGVTGVLMIILMAVVFTLASRPFRKNGTKLLFPFNRMAGFNTFWFSHHLIVLVYVLLLVHGYCLYLIHNWYQKTTWMYISIPLIIYTGERILRTFRSNSYSAKILKVALLPGNVLTLTMSKPHGFRYRSGQYIFLQCSTISSFEWHPFSITSAPSDDGLSVHIKAAGDWTRELMRIFVEKYYAIATTTSQSPSVQSKSLPKLLVDGPYGAPSQDFQNYDVLLLVGLGIGATPFVSILRDLLNNLKFSEDQKMENVGKNSFKKHTYRTTNAYFYWVTRDSNSFEWFKGVMNEVSDLDKKGAIEMHNHLTSVYEERDARSTLLGLLQALHHAKHGVDIVSGAPVRTHFARPKWKDVFSRVASKHPNKTIGVFCCGTSCLAKELRKLAYEMSSTTSTRFEFHKEFF